MAKKSDKHTGLSRHQRVRSRLVPPLNRLGEKTNLQFSSWVDERLPEVLWLSLVRTTKTQEEALAIFRRIVDGFEYKGDNALPIPTHTFLATLAPDEFDAFLSPVLCDASLKRCLGSMLLFESLPDRRHWERHLKLLDDPFKYLEEAIFHCLDHQSQESTDIRWFSISCMARNGKIVLALGHERSVEIKKELEQYPHYGDQKKVRPSIRSMEMMFRGEPGTPSEDWCFNFWKEAFEKTNCLQGERSIFEQKERLVEYDTKPTLNRAQQIYEDLVHHFRVTSNSTNLDAKHDAVFGFVFYALYLTFECLVTHSYRRAIGQIAVRVVAELLLTFAYLTKKNEAGLWARYRNYGTGQIKLNFLKLLEQEDVPAFIDMEFLERLMNEDFWHEHLEINLGHWAGADLRKLAEEADSKEIYDKYYSTTSPFVHGSWGAVRTVVFETCLNPLHRFHRVPALPNLLMRPTFEDLKKLLNQSLDLLASNYPEFKIRFREEDLPKQKT
jgi:hypothetical protein